MALCAACNVALFPETQPNPSADNLALHSCQYHCDEAFQEQSLQATKLCIIVMNFVGLGYSSY